MTRNVSVVLPSAIIYVTGTVNGVETVFALAGDYKWSAVCDTAEDDVYRVDLQAFDAAGHSTEYGLTLYYGLHLITDRTGGYYNASDLGRVESAVLYLMEQFNALPDVLAEYLAGLDVAPDSIFAVPYDYPINLPTKIDWVVEDMPTVKAMLRYLDNVKALRDAIPLPDGTPSLPESMDNLTYTGANNIERVLQIVNSATLAFEALRKLYADRAALSFIYSGEVCCGEV